MNPPSRQLPEFAAVPKEIGLRYAITQSVYARARARIAHSKLLKK